jgi:hypothetical protein
MSEETVRRPRHSGEIQASAAEVALEEAEPAGGLA